MALKDEPIFWVETFKVNNGWCIRTFPVKFKTAQAWLRCRMHSAPELKHRIKFKVFADIGESND